MMKALISLAILMLLVACNAQAPQEIGTPSPETGMPVPGPAGEGVQDTDVVDEPMEDTGESSGVVKELAIEAYNWGFNKQPVEIRKGDTVRLRLTSSSGTHGIAIPDFGVASGPVSPGEEEVIEFVADKSGTFEFYCNVYCGAGHRGMRDVLVVQ